MKDISADNFVFERVTNGELNSNYHKLLVGSTDYQYIKRVQGKVGRTNLCTGWKVPKRFHFPGEIEFVLIEEKFEFEKLLEYMNIKIGKNVQIPVRK